MEKIQTTLLARNFMKEAICEGSLVIDATMGRGFDTEYLCELVGEKGKVIGFDIQEEAFFSTKERLEQAGLLNRAQLIVKGHEYMAQYAIEQSVSGIMFNFGYLPKGDHTISTRKETSIQAIEAGLSLLKVGGVMSLCIYHGKDTGFEERDALLEYLKQIDHKKYTVIKTELYNRPNFPPIFVGIVRDKA
ncbi:MAG TPA: 16S rRNA (cytosine(1402)-N(4))-methyltransferase [Lachnospiraceae bacterium]|nr:16S rRNA (cytosine(1402)-N(4))-methyltransferase [Lachnospiraceae bacterium]HIS62297.1 SAM-dependent methyltransferase [Candidatus Scybalomonas excrementigallinarum]